jgi:23S rRNA (guanosine2251-2'-O)-methyltransferase
MNKDFTQEKLLSFDDEKQFKVLLDLAHYIERENKAIDSNAFFKLSKYHQFLQNSENQNIQKINKEFKKIKTIDYQFQVYLMNLERLTGQSRDDYQMRINLGDQNTASKTFDIICLLDSIRSAHNIGAFFRNAECFGVKKLCLTGLSPTPELDQVKKTAMGMESEVEWEYQRDACLVITQLKDQGYTIYGIETVNDAISLNSVKELPQKIVLVFGHEQFGMSAELLNLCDQIISIDLYGKKNSLNVAVSQAITLNHFTSLL